MLLCNLYDPFQIRFSYASTFIILKRFRYPRRKREKGGFTLLNPRKVKTERRKLFFSRPTFIGTRKPGCVDVDVSGSV